MVRDTTALSQGFQTAPHQSVQARVIAIRSMFTACSALANIAHRAASHMERLEQSRLSRGQAAQTPGGNVFIGHGRSLLWRELKDFISDRLGLPWDEFNRVPVAGVTNIARLSEMLDSARIAFVVLTAEDETIDGRERARQNVVHEAGLFQGRLGFTRAIVLLEDGCDEFSNIQGLGQIRFPRGQISAAFDDVRQVLEREGLC
jgi:predicted nucleotide-binding protein